MLLKKGWLIFLFALSTAYADAQTKPYLAEYAKGYRGGYIKGLESVDRSLQFAVIGDWGRGGMYFGKDVAEQLSKAVTCIDAEFIVSTGDNFYPSGVASVHDPLWNLAFENVFWQYPLWRDWYVVLGNHDYGSNPQAQIDYSKISRRWNMPDYYYSFKSKITKGVNALFIFLDTNPFNSGFHDENDTAFHPNLDTTAQKKWLEGLLSDPDTSIQWKIVFGHHPMYTAGSRASHNSEIRNSLEAMFEKYNVDLYITGHEHHLQYYHPKDKHTHHFISGAGSEANEAMKSHGPVDFFAAIQGFMTFSVTPGEVLMQAVDRNGNVLTKQKIRK
ncbi:MAG: metallophosphoesterase [Chitinophagaceae bacterium]|nr:metallophosphoesterase [Chitinophagaceae bacterium]